MNHSERLNHGVGPSTASAEAALCTSQDLSLEPAKTEANNDIPILAWEVALKDKSQPWSTEVAALPILR